jgi:hypothetical protein
MRARLCLTIRFHFISYLHTLYDDPGALNVFSISHKYALNSSLEQPMHIKLCALHSRICVSDYSFATLLFNRYALNNYPKCLQWVDNYINNSLNRAINDYFSVL